MRILEEIYDAIERAVADKAVASLARQDHTDPAFSLGKFVGEQNGLRMSLEIIHEVLEAQRKKELNDGAE